MLQGAIVYSPIVHSHPITERFNLLVSDEVRGRGEARRPSRPGAQTGSDMVIYSRNGHVFKPTVGAVFPYP